MSCKNMNGNIRVLIMNNKTKSLPKNLLTIENRVNPFTNALPVFNEGKQLLDSGKAR